MRKKSNNNDDEFLKGMREVYKLPEDAKASSIQDLLDKVEGPLNDEDREQEHRWLTGELTLDEYITILEEKRYENK